MIKKLFEKLMNKKIKEKLNHKDQLLKSTLIYLIDDLYNADDIVESTSLNDMIFDIEEELNIEKNKRITKKRFAKL